MIDNLAETSTRLPSFPIANLRVRDFERSHPGVDSRSYLTLIIFIALAAALVVFLVLNLLAYPSTTSLIGAFAGGAAVVLFLVYLPSIELARRQNEIESELPLFMRGAGLLLELGLPFTEALDESSKECPAIRSEILSLIKNVKSGVGMGKALSDFASAYDSPLIKRVVGQMLFIYESGGKGRELGVVAEDLLSIQQNQLKDYAAKSSLFGLMFVISSAILPTLFLVYAIVGGFIGGSSAPPLGKEMIALALLVVFPSISLLIILLSKSSAPRVALTPNSRLDARMVLPAIVFIAAYAISPSLSLPALVLGLALGGYLAYDSYVREKRMEELDTALPDALLAISGLPKSTPMEKVFEILKRNSLGPLSEEAETARRQLSMNLRLDSVLDDLWKRSGSLMMRRVSNSLLLMAKTNSFDKMSLLANDIIAAFRLRRERAQSFAMQRYTLIFGAILIPVILKMTLSLLGSMGGLMAGSGSPLVSFGSPVSGAGLSPIAGTVAFASGLIPMYLVIYATVSAAAIADAEGKPSSMATNFALLAILSLLAYQFVNY